MQEGAGERDRADGEQFIHVEVEADPEHQENDPDVGQLLGDLGVRHEAGGERADGDAGDEIADDRREPEPLRHEPEEDRGREGAGQREDEVEVLRHGRSIASERTTQTPVHRA